MNPNLNLYHIFHTVAECGNISAAANRLFISQPAISKSISRLEQNLNTTLFVRSSRGVSLTPEGEILQKQVDSAFASIRQGEDLLRKAEELGMGRLSIGVSTTLCRYVLLPCLRAFIHQNPHIRISVSCQSSNQTIKALENGEIDIGLTGESERAGKLLFDPLREIQDIFVTTKTYLENLKTRMQIEHAGHQGSIYSHATLLLLDKDNLSRQYVNQYLSREMTGNDRLIEVTTMDLLIEFARIDMGVACVISEFVKEDLEQGKLIRLKSPVTIPPRKIGFAYGKTVRNNRAAADFLEFVKT